MTTRIVGPREWRLSRSLDGHREYKIKHVVECDTSDGPFNILNTPGLPLPGSVWAFGGEVDPWAYCEPTAEITPTLGSEPNTQFIIEQTFGTRSPSRCQDATIEDPLLEPPDISGSFVSKLEEALQDRFGRSILTSSHEMIRGPQNEWEVGQDTVRIIQNVASSFLGYILPLSFKNCVNAFPLWGLRARCIKLSAAPWERKFFGNCNIYYRRTLEFLIDVRTFDRDIVDEGSKALSGHWDRVTGGWKLDAIAGETPNRYNPNHYVKFSDRNGNPTRVILDGFGCPSGVSVIGRETVPARRADRSSAQNAASEAATLMSGALTGIIRLVQMVIELYQGNPSGFHPDVQISAEQTRSAAITANASASRSAGAVNGSLASTLALTTVNDVGTFAAYMGGGIPPGAVGGGFIGLLREIADIASIGDPPPQMIDVQLFAARVAINADAAYQAAYDAYQQILGIVASDTGTGTSIDVATDISAPGYIHVEKYSEVDFLQLGIPLTF